MTFDHIIPFSAWVPFDLPAVRGDCFRRVFRQMTASRQLVGYLTHLCTGTTLVCFQVNEPEFPPSVIANFSGTGFASRDLREIFAQDCYEILGSSLDSMPNQILHATA